MEDPAEGPPAGEERRASNASVRPAAPRAAAEKATASRENGAARRRRRTASRHVGVREGRGRASSVCARRRSRRLARSASRALAAGAGPDGERRSVLSRATEAPAPAARTSRVPRRRDAAERPGRSGSSAPHASSRARASAAGMGPAARMASSSERRRSGATAPRPLAALRSSGSAAGSSRKPGRRARKRAARTTRSGSSTRTPARGSLSRRARRSSSAPSGATSRAPGKATPSALTVKSRRERSVTGSPSVSQMSTDDEPSGTWRMRRGDCPIETAREPPRRARASANAAAPSRATARSTSPDGRARRASRTAPPTRRNGTPDSADADRARRMVRRRARRPSAARMSGSAFTAGIDGRGAPRAPSSRWLYSTP